MNDPIIAAAMAAWETYAYNSGITEQWDNLDPQSQGLWIALAERTVSAYRKQERLIDRTP